MGIRGDAKGETAARRDFGELPEVLTVEEAAAILRIGRGAAYELARRYRESGGAEGLPVVALGRSLRVPRAALARLLGVESDKQPATPPDVHARWAARTGA
jgi:transposase